MYSICNTIYPATSVEHSIECHFYNLQETNLVVAGGDILTIYNIIQKPHVKLEQRQTYELHGSVTSLAKISLGSRQSRRRDSIVVSFNDAKLSIVEYDPETHDLKTISMHYFEDDKLRGGSVNNHLYFPLVRVDPENRCVAMLIYGKHIVVIPIDKEEEDDLDDELYNSASDDEGDVTNVQPDSEQNVLPSYIIDLSEQGCGERIENICDIQFLHNYNDPTLALLYEPTRTWSGRVAARQDTFSLIALSMNLQQKIQPIIWKVNDLPYDCLRILPVPKPISGLLIIACNEIMYLNQSVPPFGMSFNTFSKESTMFPLKEPPIVEMEVDEEPQAPNNQGPENDSEEEKQTDTQDIHIEENKEQQQQQQSQNQADDTCDSTNTNTEPKVREKKKRYINISLDLSQAVFLDYNKILFILKDGDVYLVTLSNDDMRSIKEFRFQLIDSTVQPNCVTLCQNNILFIGSHVGDSVLVELIGELQEMRDDLDDIYNETTTATAITNNMNNHSGTIGSSDQDISMVNGNNKEPLRLCERDKLISSSSSGRLCYGEAPYFIDNSSYDQNIELVMTSGLHKSGSLCVLQRTIKTTTLDTYELKDCACLWTLKPSASSDPKQSRLLLNRGQETMIFTTNNELLELRQTERVFETSEPTIMAANVGPDDLTIQVMSFGAKLISDDKTITFVQFESKVYDACIIDSHVMALKDDDSLYHLEIVSNSDGYSIGLQDIAPLTEGKVVSISLYKDLSGIFTCSGMTQSNHQAIGHSGGSTNHRGNSNQDRHTYWLFLVDERGVMEIFSVPDFRSVYSIDNFPSLPIVLTDNIKSFIRDLDTSIAKIQEILVCGLGRDKSRPLLLIRSEIELVIYEAYSYADSELNFHLKIRFRKLNSILMTTLAPPMHENGMILDHPDEYRVNNPRAIMASNHHNHDNHDRRRKKSSKSTRDRNYYRQRLRDRFVRSKHWLVPYDGVGGYKGIFISGFKPHWLFMSDFGALRIHPMNLDGPIYSFAPFNDNNFIYYTANQELKIASLPSHTNLDHDWPIRKLYLKETVHFVNYHVERKIYCVVTSSPSPCSKIMKVGSEPDTMKVEDLERDGNYIHPTTEKFTLQLYDPENWELIPDCKIEFEEWEQVTCVKNVMLTSEGTKSGLKGYIAVSTNYCYGEDVPNRGRILILDLIEVVPEPNRPLTKNKIKKVYCEEQKGPVTTLSHVCGLLLSAVGQKIYLWQLKEERLDGVAFIDTQIYINCATSVKNLVLVSDVCKSLSLLRYQQETRTLSMVCRDPKPLEVFACDFVVNNESLHFVCTDSEKNILIYSHDPEDEDSYGGTRLIRRADYHLGAHVTCLCRLRSKMPSCLENASQNEIVASRRRHLNLFCTVDGALGYLYPIDESMFKRLQQLQSEMTVALPHAAGLNPKAWRLIKQARPGIAMPCKQIVDGNLLNRFMTLSSKERNELTKKIGTSTDVILSDLQYIYESALHF